MKRPENDKWLDDDLERAIRSERSEPDFEEWRRANPEAVAMLTSRAGREHSASVCRFRIGSMTMKSQLTKLAAAAVIIIAVALSISLLHKSMPTASAAEVLASGSEAMSRLSSVYIKVQIRTRPGGKENFDFIGLDYDFVPHEMWKEFDGGPGRWRIENSGRVEVMDGQWSLLFISPNLGARRRGEHGYNGWLKGLLDVHKVLDRELGLAVEEGSELFLTRETGEDGCEKLIVTVEAHAQGDFRNDWCRDTSIWESDNSRVYRFDAETNLLEGLEVYVHTDVRDVLVLETLDVEHNVDIDPLLFTLEFPDDVIWLEEPEVLGEKYQLMSPREVAEAFFQACADEEWDEVLKLRSTSEVPGWLREKYGGLEVISVGEPFKSGLYPGWFVPYEVKLKSGHIKKMNLAVRNDNPARRYVVDGGL